MRQLVFCLLFLPMAALWAQTQPLDHDVYTEWKSIEDSTLSPDGGWVVWRETVERGDATMRLFNTVSGERIGIERGSKPAFSRDGAFLAYAIEPGFEQSRQAKLDDDIDAPVADLAIRRLADGDTTTIERVTGFTLPRDQSRWIVYQVDTSEASQDGEDSDRSTEDSDDADKDNDEKADSSSVLVLRELVSGEERRFGPLASYAVDDAGNRVVFALKEGDQAGVYTLVPGDAEPTRLYDGKAKVFDLAVDESGEQTAFLLRPTPEPAKDESAGEDTGDEGDKEAPEADEQAVALYHWRDGMASALLLADDTADFLRGGWSVSEHAELAFSENGKRLFFGTAPTLPEPDDDDQLLKEEKVVVDIWHWQDSKLQPMQKEELEERRKQHFLAVAHLTGEGPRLVQLGDEQKANVIPDEDREAEHFLAVSGREYETEMSWDYPWYYDAYLINVETGESRRVLERVQDWPSFSPEGRYITWWDRDNAAWMAYSLEEDESIELSRRIDVSLADHTNDRPYADGDYGAAGWLADDAAFVFNGRFDLWMVDPERPRRPVNLTNGYGRAEKLELRWQDLDEDEQAIAAPLLLRGFNTETKASGFFRLNEARAATPQQLVFSEHAYDNLARARDADQMLFTRESFREFPDLHVTGPEFSDSRRISDANPQQSNYRWGSAELVSWQSDSGKDHDGLLFVPDGLDRSQAHPMIVYFYERGSDGLHRYRQPRAHRSVIIPSFYVSRGYVVFIPDVHYREGYPGESAMASIMPMVNQLAARDWIDAGRIGIQGHSWAGYQIAYMVTQTDAFRAAAGGAPVANMVSAYGGIRWGSGMSRMFQYERTQSRLGKTLWEAPELYLDNSPIFEADQVNTPLLMMHNDHDGAVPWEQGIEMFTALRRLGKPAWLVNYNDEPHWPTTFANRRDWQVRLQQYFDHYLKGDPAPVWLARGIPAVAKGSTLGLEAVED